MASQRSDFTKIRFGYASAESEREREPELLISAFYDNQGYIEEAVSGARFIFLGYKGSGKSAIGQKLVLQSGTESNLNVETIHLKDFPFNAFKKIGSADSEQEARFPTTWAWLILLRILELFDGDSTGKKSPEFQRTVNELKQRGFIGSDDLKGIVVKSAKNKFQTDVLSIIKIAHETSSADGGVPFLTLVNLLRKLVSEFESRVHHLLVIDGLDDVLSKKELQLNSLAALIQEVNQINGDLQKNGSHSKVVVLCRTDIFESLPDANKNKLRQDSAITLDWYRDTLDPEQSALVKLADMRIQVSLKDNTVGLKDFLPSVITGERTIKRLLDLTRHTPRDFIQLLHYIQEFAEPDTKLSEDQIQKGIRNYSINYFLPEIQDELVGVASPPQIEAVIDLFSAMGKRDFKYRELLDYQERHDFDEVKELPISNLLKALYDRSAVGTIKADGGKDKYTFKFRNRNSTLGFPDRLILHRGIWKALNL